MIKEITPLFLNKPWAGEKLAKLKGVDSELIGESWEVATIPEGHSLIDDISLLEKMGKLTYVTKFIDTNDYLSVQVHPTDAYALEVENSTGKDECWYILNAEDGCGVYLGFKPGITKKEFANAISSGVDISQFLNFVKVKKGDFIYVPAGSVHSIGKGVTLCEVQQASGITYRVWDWNRKGLNGKPRDLHIEKALDVLNFNTSFNKKLVDDIKNIQDETNLIVHPQFSVDLIKGKKSITMKRGDSITELMGSYKTYIALEDSEFTSSSENFLGLFSQQGLDSNSLLSD